MSSIELELKAEFAFIDIKNIFTGHISDQEFLVTRITDCIAYSATKTFKRNLNYILEQMIIHQDEFNTSNLSNNNKVFIEFINRVIESIKDRTKIISKEEIISFENKLDDNESTKYIKSIHKVMDYFNILYLN